MSAAPVGSRGDGRFKKRKYGSGHAYYYDGVKLDSVTRLLGGLPKPALVEWAARSAADEAVEHWTELSMMPKQERYDVIRNAHRSVRDDAANRGSEVHRLAEKLGAGEAVAVPPLLEGHVRSAVAFLDDFQIEVIAAEVSGFNLSARYAGTFDLLCRSRIFPDRRILLDYKTNRTGIYGETALQLEAYSRFEAIDDGQGGEVSLADAAGGSITDHWAVHIKSDGYQVFDMERGDEPWELFEAGAKVARAMAGDRGETRLDFMKGRQVFASGGME